MAVDQIARTMALDAAQQGGGGGGDTSDYSQLTNKPTINGVELNGDQTTASLGIKELTPSVVDENLIFSIS